MVKLKIKRASLGIVLALFMLTGVMLPVTRVFGAPTPATTDVPAVAPGQGLEISPPLIEQKSDPGQSVDLTIKLRNITKSTLIAKASADDFVTQGEEGVPKVLIDPNDVSPYSIRGWLEAVPDQKITPNQQVSIKIKLNVPAKASPGGHYGVIRFTALPEGVEGSGVALSASIGTLLLVTVSGPVTENAKIEEFSISQSGKKSSFYEYGPLSLTEKISNSGSIHFKPVGEVVIKNTFGRQVAVLKVNDPPGNILPSSTRKFTQTLDKKRLFGRYKATLTLIYGSSNKTLNQTIYFWVIPYKLIAVILFAIILAIIILRFSLKRYKRRILSKNRPKDQQSQTYTPGQNQNPASPPDPNEPKPKQDQ